ncbi:MAG: PQQ-binding-like beta-propeller repeat protein [Alphaproteobacteria bacterium]|nr:PQQ-binding-like beta-propeller repeat protein [Alphaproteobacteria bacterium]
MKFATSFAVIATASLLCAGASLAQAPAGLTEGNPPMSQNLRNALAPPPPLPQLVIPPATNEWLTWGYDQERTGWNRAETTLSPKTVGKMKQLWSTQLAVPVDKYVLSTMTAPIVVAGVATPSGPADLVFILGANDTLFAIDAGSGKQIWSKSFPNPHKSTAPIRDWLCPKTVNSTPTVDKARGIVFFMTGDGMLRGLNLADGAERLTPAPMTAPFARAWSLNLIDNVLYSPSGRACGEVTDKSSLEYSAAMSGLRRAGTGPLLDASALNAADVSDLSHPVVTHFFTSGARPAAPWGRAGVARAPGGVMLETSDGRYDPASGDFSESILKIAPKASRLMDSYTPSNWMDNLMHDMSGSASPVVFNFAGKTLAAVSQKEAVLRILDTNALGGANHQTPLYQSSKLGNDEKTGTDPGRGVWGAISSAEVNGKRFVYLPMSGHPSKDAPTFPGTNGPIPNGTVMAFQIVSDAGKISAVPAWTGNDMIMPDPPVVANGVVYALSTGGQALQNGAKPGDPRMPYDVSAVLRSTPVGNMTLYAYDAESGKQLWSSGKTLTDWVHFSEPVVALGKIFVATHDGHVVAFGLKK